MSPHISEAATGCKRCPFLCRGIAKAFLSMNGTIHPMERFPILVNQLRWIQLGVDHHGIEGRMSKQGLDHMHGRIVVQVLGGKDPAAVMRMQR